MVNTPTNFLNMKRRRIFQGERGGFFVRDADGKMHRGIKAAYRKVGANGNESKLGPKNRESVPVKLRRAVRKNAGVARKPKNENEGGIINGIVNALVGDAVKTRKTRKNKGVKRGPRKTKAARVPRLPAAPVVQRHPMNRPKKLSANLLPARRPARVPRLPAAPVVAMHPMNLPVASVASNASRAPRLPAAPVIAMHPMNRPKASRKTRKNKGVKRGPRKPNTSNYMLLPSSPIPRLPAPPVVKLHPMNRPKAANYNFGPFQSA